MQFGFVNSINCEDHKMKFFFNTLNLYEKKMEQKLFFIGIIRNVSQSLIVLGLM